jgi:hypothetical protein
MERHVIDFVLFDDLLGVFWLLEGLEILGEELLEEAECEVECRSI